MTVVNMRSRKPYKTSPVNDVDVGQTKDWVIKKLLARGEVSRLIAPPKAGKSAVAASICNHVAAGIDFHGLKIKQRSSVLYFALERPGLTRRRADSRATANGPGRAPYPHLRGTSRARE